LLQATSLTHVQYVTLQARTAEVLKMPMSTTGKVAWISTAVMHAIARHRRSGIPFVLISGARSTTVLARLPWLPQADAVVAENGGKIWLADGEWPSPLPLREDIAWTNTHRPTIGTCTTLRMHAYH
jgi:hypothetical protein